MYVYIYIIHICINMYNIYILHGLGGMWSMYAISCNIYVRPFPCSSSSRIRQNKSIASPQCHRPQQDQWHLSEARKTV